MSGHIVLLGDSIFDNVVYVPGGPSVIEHVRRVIPRNWTATLLAVDGATISSVERQLSRMPDGASHLVLSVGGNDALGHSAFILNEATDSYASALAEMARIRDGFSDEYSQMLDRVSKFRLPLAICTIYDQVPGLRPPESAGLSLFNEVITKQAVSVGATLIDLRLTCDEPTDYAAISPIEPSALGGGKIARAIENAVFRPGDGSRVIV